MENNYILIIYGCDYEKNGRGLGEESKARIRKAVQFIERQQTAPTAIVLAAGPPPNTTHKPLHHYMKQRLERYFLKKAVESALFEIPNIVCARKNYWGTFAETYFANEIAECYSATHVVAVSSWYHLYRVALIFSLIDKVGKTLHVVGSWKTRHWWSPFLEPFKMVKAFKDYSKNVRKKKAISPS